MLLLMFVCTCVKFVKLVYAPEQTGLLIRLRGLFVNTLNSD